MHFLKNFTLKNQPVLLHCFNPQQMTEISWAGMVAVFYLLINTSKHSFAQRVWSTKQLFINSLDTASSRSESSKKIPAEGISLVKITPHFFYFSFKNWKWTKCFYWQFFFSSVGLAQITKRTPLYNAPCF